MAVRSVEVVMAVKGAAATVAAEEEVAREEAAEAEETVSGTCVGNLRREAECKSATVMRRVRRARRVLQWA